MSTASFSSSDTAEHYIPFIEQCLKEYRYETARRHCQLAKESGQLPEAQYLKLMFEVSIGLSDMQMAYALIKQSNTDEFEHALMQMRYFGRFNNTGAYRSSLEKKQGYTQFEYVRQMSEKMIHWYNQARNLAVDQKQKDWVDTYAGMYVDADLPPSLQQRITAHKVKTKPTSTPPARSTAVGTVTGRITFANGKPVAHTRIVLGLEMDYKPIDPLNYLSSDMHFEPNIGKLESVEGLTDEHGHFELLHVPVGCHAFLAVCLDPSVHANCTRFVARDITVNEGRITHLDRSIKQWKSASPTPLPNELPILPRQWHARESQWERIGQMTLRNPFAYDFPRQIVGLDWPVELDATAVGDDELFVVDTQTPDQVQACQLADGKVWSMTGLDAYVTKRLVIYRRIDGKQSAASIARPSHLNLQVDSDKQRLIIDTQSAAFAIPFDADKYIGPILAVQGQDGQWRGQGQFHLPDGLTVTSQKTQVLEQGAIRAVVEVAYTLSDQTTITYTLTAHEGEPVLLVHEKIDTPVVTDTAFELSFADCLGGRGYLHWIGGGRSKCWEDLDGDQDRLLARLQEQTPWWIPPQGFAYAMTPAQLKDDDYISVFTIRRGEWKDEDFDVISHGPIDGNRELDWPYPEMVGSTISMITANYVAKTDNRDAKVCFRFPMFKGERYWGIAVSERDLNDGVHKHLSELQHKNSSPRLDDFIRWELDRQDTCERPVVWGPSSRIMQMRKTRDKNAFKSAWQKVTQNPNKPGYGGLAFLLEADPLIAWRTKLQLVAQAPIRSRMILLGREYSDMYSPVGARNLTPWCEEYDALAASGVFTEDEERLIRQSFILIGHLHRTRDFMNWNYGSRNANFEADRVDVVGTVGLVFPGNPDAKGFIQHALEMTEQGMKAYCTPASGRWYENPACYYLHAMKCRLHLLIRLAQVGLLDPAQVELLKELLGWGILLLTPGIPTTIPQMALPCDDATYHELDKIRRVAPIGDHASLGSEIPEHWAILADYFDKSDSDFSNLLRWAFVSCNVSGGHFGDIPLYLSNPHVADTAINKQPVLTSRRLEGFGSIFRDHFNETDEFYLLFKLGPGGYRYHRTEGSIILFVDGKPLIYDGGEDGETWRHSTLSFYDTHMPLAPGHLQRFAALPNLQFSQGVNPKAIAPGEPDFLNDDCRHELVQVAFDRFNEKNPANARSVWWIKDEYALLHDDLHLDSSIPSHWHLQVVGQSETRVADGDYRFVGRFGTDMQVLLPDQTFIDESVTDNTLNLGTAEKNRVPFSMRHLQVSKDAATHYTAVLRPLGHRKPVSATLIKQGDTVVGTVVTGDQVNDVLLHNREQTTVNHKQIQFTGTYGAMLQRHDQTHLLLMDQGEIQANDITLKSTGPSAELRVGKTTTLTVIGEGQVNVTINGQTHTAIGKTNESTTIEL
ncbi:MAG TPA: hypothetical protein DCM28_23660 [Phycisphaerales bacterium]|nr:hypothetical protein [Phycisphaerales bacterium]HCD32036.1 hypothetical protein [Phycisphaerales bacterium]|tara:strand:+ start:192291 stop:196535 length:4245 start_codon:yes stop_codon:yes gene_type:complete